MRIIPLVTMLMFAAAAVSANLVSSFGDFETITVPMDAPTITRVFVFTDTSCPYCMLLHERRNELLARGIEIQYLFYPRTGPETESFRQAVAVWCSTDRLAALDLALHGKTLPEVDCEHPVQQHYELARELELLGTPAIVTENGFVTYGVPSAKKIFEMSNASVVP